MDAICGKRVDHSDSITSPKWQALFCGRSFYHSRNQKCPWNKNSWTLNSRKKLEVEAPPKVTSPSAYSMVFFQQAKARSSKTNFRSALGHPALLGNFVTTTSEPPTCPDSESSEPSSKAGETSSGNSNNSLLRKDKLWRPSGHITFNLSDDINLQWLIRKWSVQKGIDHTYGSDWNNAPCPGGTIVQSYVLLLARMPIATLWIACIFYDNFHKRQHDFSRSIVYQHYSRKILSWNDLSIISHHHNVTCPKLDDFQTFQEGVSPEGKLLAPEIESMCKFVFL